MSITSTFIGQIAINFMNVLNQLQIYHWKTNSYSRHVAVDGLIKNTKSNMDRIIESLQGKSGYKLNISKNTTVTYHMHTDESIVSFLTGFGEWLQKLNANTERDINNIIDEIIVDVNKTLYLFSLQ